jgi:arylsulfatase A-like enzyme
LARLKELKIDDDTIVFISSDNGPHKEGGADPLFFQSAGPFRGHKRDLTDGGIREPMIVRWPGHVRAGAVSNLVWAFWDFLPTAAELAGTKSPAGLDGISVVPTLMGKGTQKQHEFLYWEFHEGGFQQAVRMGDWKAIRSKQGQPLELYDVVRDPHEDKNVAAEHAEAVGKIETYLKTARSDSERWPDRAKK